MGKFDLEKYRSIGVVGARVRGGHFTRDIEKRRERDLSDYRAARKEGIQPDGTQGKQIEKAKRISDGLGTAYRGDDKTKMYQDAGASAVESWSAKERKSFREKA